MTGTTSDSSALLGGFLDWYRGVAEHKIDGLTREQATAAATAAATPSGPTMLGLIKHLAWVERRWFPTTSSAVRPNPSTTPSRSCSRRPTPSRPSWRSTTRTAPNRGGSSAAPSIDGAAALPHDVFGDVTLEWILVHMIEETARHAGHLDILRELTDGRTGD